MSRIHYDAYDSSTGIAILIVGLSRSCIGRNVGRGQGRDIDTHLTLSNPAVQANVHTHNTRTKIRERSLRIPDQALSNSHQSWLIET